MSILICSATARELAALAPERFPDEDAIPEMQPMLAEGKAQRLIFLVTGVGPINAALAMGYCLGVAQKENEIKGIVYAGLAGAFDLDLTPLRSIWLVNREIWPEYGLNDGITVTAPAFKLPLWKDKETLIYEQIEMAGIKSLPIKMSREPDWKECASLTVAGVTASFQRREALWNLWHAPLENMEGFAAGYTALRAGIPLVEIRSISNKAGPRRPEEKDFDGALKALGQILPALNLN